MSNISESRLRALAGNDSIELRVGRGDNDQKELVTREGSWGGRLVRNLTSLFGTPKTGGYIDAKTEVLKTLQDMYGKDIGTRVFRANIGHMEDGVHLSSKAHPITGRHIRQMIEQGDREILQKYSKPGNGGVSFGSTGLKTPQGEDAPSERCTQDWMLRKSAGMSGPSREDPPNLGESFDRRGMELHNQLVGPGGNQPVVDGRPIAKLLLDDVELRREEEPNNASPSWTLDIDLPNGNGHQIGLRVDPENPGKVNVFDSRRGEYSVSTEDLGTWLAAHLKKNYSVEGLQLHRAGETMLDKRFVEQEGEHVLERHYDTGDMSKTLGDTFLFEANKAKQPLGDRENPFEVTPQFVVDLPRGDIQITLPGGSTVLSVDNWEQLLSDVVGDCSEDELRTGVFNLSAMLNQGLGNSLNSMCLPQVFGEVGLPQYSGEFLQRVSLTKDETNGMVRIDVSYSQPVSMLDSQDDEPRHLLDLRSRIHGSVSFEVPIEELRKENGFESFRIVGEPEAGLKLISQRGLREHNPEGTLHTNVALFRENERLVGQGLNTLSGSQSQIIRECMRDGSSWMENHQLLSNDFVEHLKASPGSVVFGNSIFSENVNLTGVNGPRLRDLPGVTETGANALSFLLAPSIGQELHEGIMKRILRDPGFVIDPNDPPRLTTTISPVLLNDGTQALEIEYRGSIPEGLLESNPLTVLHHMGEPPEGRVGFETVVRIRVPVPELNQGNTGSFDFVHTSRIEGRPIPNQE